MNKRKNKSVFKITSIILSTISTYILIFFYFFFTHEKEFKKNITNLENLNYYKNFSSKINHLRYEDSYRTKKIGSDLIFNTLKNDSDNKIILFQGDSWFAQINHTNEIKDFLKKKLKNYSKIINGGTSSYSPSLMQVQFDIIEKDFGIQPNVVVIYIDQTDIGDELCRYKNLLNIDAEGNLVSVSMEKFPLYNTPFNLHEKIYFSELQAKNKNKIITTQLFINYKIKKSLIKLKKKFQIIFIDESMFQKCYWETIEGYTKYIKDDEKRYFNLLVKRFFKYLNNKHFIERIYVVTHPHKSQMNNIQKSNNVSNLVEEVVQDFEKIEHINFSKLLKYEKQIYKEKFIWKKDNIHLNNKSYISFLKYITETISQN